MPSARNAKLWLAATVAFLAIHPALGQSGWFAAYQARAAATQVDQPHWASPLITNNARIEQGLRSDFIRQTASNGQTTWNDGGTKGLQIIPFARTELRFSPPPFFIHSQPKIHDGFGDVAFRLKYRLYGSNESHHNAIASALLTATLPTGKQANGSCCAILTPSIESGKGFGPITFTFAAVGNLPVSNTKGLGRSVVFNHAIQYRLPYLLWPQIEFNATRYAGGKYDGRVQTFITPGLIMSGLPLIRGQGPGAPSPLSLTLGLGEQTALTSFHTYNHSPVITGRLRF